MRNPFYEMILEKKLARLPLLGHPVSFIQVKYIAEMIIQAENKLDKGDADVVGESFKLVVIGQPSRDSTQFQSGTWSSSISH